MPGLIVGAVRAGGGPLPRPWSEEFLSRVGDHAAGVFLAQAAVRAVRVAAGLVLAVLLLVAAGAAHAPARHALADASLAQYAASPLSLSATERGPGGKVNPHLVAFTASAYQSARPVLAWGAGGDGSGAFRVPIDVALGADGSVYVLDYGYSGLVDGVERYREARVQRFDPEGRFLAAWGHGQLNRPFGLAVDAAGDVWVADTFNHLVRRYSPDGTLRSTWGGHGAAPGQLDRPTDLTIAGNEVYVVEFGSDRVQVLGMDGSPRRAWGVTGSGPGQLRGPHGIAVDDAGRVYVADTNNHRIAVFSTRGELLETWASDPAQDPACPPPYLGQFCRPRHLALDPAGNVLVADRNHHRIQVFTSAGQPLASIGGEGRALGQLSFPYAAAIDEIGRLYVADAGNDRIQVYVLGAPFRAHLPFAPR
jgi:DNA-binding beta-propeller fold protein YncE